MYWNCISLWRGATIAVHAKPKQFYEAEEIIVQHYNNMDFLKYGLLNICPEVEFHHPALVIMNDSISPA